MSSIVCPPWSASSVWLAVSKLPCKLRESASRWVTKRSRKSSLGVDQQRLFMTPEKDDSGRGRGQGEDQQPEPNRPGDPMHRGSQHISAEAETRRPDDPASSIEEKEARPRHAISTGEQRGKRAQQGDKTAEEDDHASVTAKEILPELKPPLVKPDALAVA